MSFASAAGALSSLRTMTPSTLTKSGRSVFSGMNVALRRPKPDTMMPQPRERMLVEKRSTESSRDIASSSEISNSSEVPGTPEAISSAATAFGNARSSSVELDRLMA